MFFGAMNELVLPEPDNEVALRLSDVVALLIAGDRSAAELQLRPLIGVTCVTHPILKLPTRESAEWSAGTGDGSEFKASRKLMANSSQGGPGRPVGRAARSPSTHEECQIAVILE